LAVGVLPGVLLLWATGAVRALRWLEVSGLGIVVSLPIVQLLTMISILGHVSCAAVTVAYALLLAALCLALCFTSWSSRAITLNGSRSEAWVAAAILLMAALLYVKGSPFFSDEEQYHISVIRRLTFHPSPALDNFY